MTTDASHETATDTPAAWQHAWKRAARQDPRMRAVHLAVVDAFAEHYYPGREALRGVALSVERIAFWTRLGERAIKGARADLARWGWLGVVKHHGRGKVARYALTVPDEVGITPPVVHKEGTTRTVKPVAQTSEKCTTRTAKAVDGAPRAPIPLPTPHLLPTRPLPTSSHDQDATAPAGRRGRQEKPSTNNQPRPDRATLERAIPAGVLDSARGKRSAPVLASALASALAAGWTPGQVRDELEGADAGARSAVGVVVSRLRALAATPPATSSTVREIDPEEVAAAIRAGQVCPDGNADLVNPSTGLHICPICRRAGATA